MNQVDHGKFRTTKQHQQSSLLIRATQNRLVLSDCCRYHGTYSYSTLHRLKCVTATRLSEVTSGLFILFYAFPYLNIHSSSLRPAIVQAGIEMRYHCNCGMIILNCKQNHCTHTVV